MNDIDDIPPPIPSINEKIIDELEEFNILNKEFNEFQNNIRNNYNYDSAMKDIMIKTRKEYIENLSNKLLKENKENLMNNFFDKIKGYENKYLESRFEILELKINEYIHNPEVKEIILDYELYYEIYELLNKISDNLLKKKLHDIFKTDDLEKFNEYLEIIKISKNDYELLQKKNNEIKELRKKKFLSVFSNFEKLSKFDKSINDLKINISQTIEDYLLLKINNLEINEEYKNKFIEFLNSIRIEKNDKDYIINLI